MRISPESLQALEGDSFIVIQFSSLSELEDYLINDQSNDENRDIDLFIKSRDHKRVDELLNEKKLTLATHTTDSCPICLEETDSQMVSTSCGHIFHFKCIDRITNNSCPMCRSSLTTIQN